ATGSVDDLLAGDVFGEGIEAVNGTAGEDFVVCPAVTDHDHGAAQVPSAQGFDLAAILGQRVFGVNADGYAIGVKYQTVGQHMFRRDAVFGDDRFDKFMEAAGNDADFSGIILQGFLVANNGGADLRFQ